MENKNSHLVYRIKKSLPFKKDLGLTVGQRIEVYYIENGMPNEQIYLNVNGKLVDYTKILGGFDFKNSEFLAPYYGEIKMFKRGDVVYTKTHGMCYISSEKIVSPPQKGVKLADRFKVKPLNKKTEYFVLETEIIPVTWYWFINSSGVLQKDYEEREDRKVPTALQYRKYCGNFYRTEEEGKKIRENILNHMFD